MTERITASQFHAAGGVEDWRVLLFVTPGMSASTYFRTGSFATGLKLVDAIGALADAADHHPDIDLQYPGVIVRLSTHSVGGLSDKDLALARQISAAARDLGVTADPTAVQAYQIAIDAMDIPLVLPFWRAVLGYLEHPKFPEQDALDPRGRGPSIWFQQLDAPRQQRNRIHIDLCVPHDQTQARVDAAVAAGGRVVRHDKAPEQWWTLADPEGNEVDITSWTGRE